jgi:hypothetical protein
VLCKCDAPKIGEQGYNGDNPLELVVCLFVEQKALKPDDLLRCPGSQAAHGLEREQAAILRRTTVSV